MSGLMTTRHSPPLHVNVAVASDPGAHRPSASKANSTVTVSSPPTNSVQSSLNLSQVQDMGMTYPHISVCRSLHMEVQISSPSVKVVHQEELQISRSLPVFHENDRVGGRIILDPACHQSGRLSISIEGVFHYTSSQTQAVDDSYNEKPSNGRHVFLSSTNVIPVGPPSDLMTPRTPAFIRDAFSTHGRRRPSVSSVHSAKDGVKEGSTTGRCIPFAFDMPLGRQSGQEMPPTFSTSSLVMTGTRGRSFVEKAEVTYKVTALWEPSDGYENRAQLEVPLILQPDNDFQSLDAIVTQPEFWLEMPLSSDRSIPFQCAITLPSSGNFPRTSSLPYYVVFTSVPRSLTLAREIAMHATISVALVREVTLSAPPSLPPTPPLTPSSSADESDSSISHRKTHRRLFSRVTKSAPAVLLRTPRIPEETTSTINKPLPRLPSADTQPFSESRVLHTDAYKGFPKRPRDRGSEHQSNTNDSLPDGLYKGQILLKGDMLPTIDWPGVGVKYHLDVNVLFRQDKASARIPIRIY